MKIIPLSSVASYKQGTLVGVTYDQIVTKLGFKPNVQDDTSKVRWSWGFQVSGHKMAIWDWRGSADDNRWSFFGPSDVMADFFGERSVTVGLGW